MRNKFLITMLIFVMTILMVACGNEDITKATTNNTTKSIINNTESVEMKDKVLDEEGSVLNIYCWDEEFKKRVKKYYTIPEGITINWVITSTDENAYQQKLDDVLLKQDEVDVNDKIDLFLVESDYASKYVEIPYTLDVQTTIGLSDEDVSEMYEYTKEVMTDSTGSLKGVTGQVCPAGFIYRRSIAIDILGTDDPIKVQAAIDSWEKFNEVAAQAKEKDYFMLSGVRDAYRVFANDASSPWVVDNKIIIRDELKDWVAQAKHFEEMGYYSKKKLWTKEYEEGTKSNVFGYFGPGWFVDSCLSKWTIADSEEKEEVGNGTYGDWAMCKGPQSFFWGGTWICVAAGTDNLETAKDLLYAMACDKDILKSMAQDMGDSINNVSVMEELTNSNYSNPFLGGQNHFSVYAESARMIDMSNRGFYDQVLNDLFQSVMSKYFEDILTLEEAYTEFFEEAMSKYPNLTY